MRAVPLGQREGARLEFKRADVLAKPESVAREVVSMLNAEGGEVWVGLEEENAYAVRVTPVRDAARERGRLLDHLVDTIEPTPAGADMRVEVVAHGDADLLVVCVQRGARPPYAQIKGDLRRYVKRVDDRLRPLSRDELRDLFLADRKHDDQQDLARRLLRSERDRRQQEQRSGLWLAIQAAAPGLEFDVADDGLLQALMFPRYTRNRDDGWVCVGYASPQLNAEARSLDDGAGRRTQIHQDGRLLIELPLSSLVWREAGVIWPFALVEYVVSAFRLARTLYQLHDVAQSAVLADFALFGLLGWRLRPCSPGTIEYDIGGRAGEIRPFDRADLMLLKATECSGLELLENEDGCAWPIVEHVYKDFGYRGHPIPREFNPQTRRLMLGP